jgi:hypothetical protein
MAHDYAYLDGRTPYKRIHARTPDFSSYAQFEWYKPVYYFDSSEDVADDKRKLSRWLGVVENQGSPGTYVIFPKSCILIARTMVYNVLDDVKLGQQYADELRELDEAIQR